MRGARQMPQINKDELAANIAAEYGVKKDEVAKAIENNTDIRDIGQAAMFAKLSGKSFASVLAMKSDWRDVAKKLGISGEDIRKEQERVAAVRIAKRTELKEAKVQELLNAGYAPRDIEIAARIGKAAGKDVDTVLAARKINNQWRDVAKEFGVTEDQIAKKGERRVAGAHPDGNFDGHRADGGAKHMKQRGGDNMHGNFDGAHGMDRDHGDYDDHDDDNDHD